MRNEDLKFTLDFNMRAKIKVHVNVTPYKARAEKQSAGDNLEKSFGKSLEEGLAKKLRKSLTKTHA